jgi:hypothetical protein
MRAVGPVDGRGRLAVVGSAAAGAVTGGLAGWLGLGLFDLPLATEYAAVPVAGGLVAAAVFVWLLLLTWRRRGGYRHAAEVDAWLRARRVPPDVPSATWRPAVEAIAGRRTQAWSQVVLGGFWILWAAVRFHDDGPAVAVPMGLIWACSIAYHLGWVLPRVRAGRMILARGVSTG